MTSKQRVLSIKRLRADYPFTDVLELPQSQRAAHCLDWCATHYYNQWIYWNWLWQAINGQKRTPAQNNRLVELLRGRGSAIRQILIKKYGRTLTTSRELGAVRATVDSQDVLDSGEMEKHIERLESASRAVVVVGGLIDPKQLRNDTPQRAALKDFYTEAIVPTIRQVGSSRFQRYMLTPRRAAKQDKE